MINQAQKYKFFRHISKLNRKYFKQGKKRLPCLFYLCDVIMHGLSAQRESFISYAPHRKAADLVANGPMHERVGHVHIHAHCVY